MKMKKMLAGVLATALMLSTGCAPSSPAMSSEPVSTENRDNNTDSNQGASQSVSAEEIAKNMRIGLNLGNTMEAYEATDCEKVTFEWIPVVGNNTPQDYETNWGAVVTTQEVIDGIKASGFDTVRIPVFWGNMMENDGEWTINADYIARVKEIVDYCVNDNLYVVINIHHFDEFVIRRNTTADCERIFTRLWTQIADYFKNYSYNVVFEGYNEYLGGNQFNENGELVEVPKTEAYIMTNKLNQAFVDAVRSTGGNNTERVLIVSGYWTNIDNTTSDLFIMPKDTAIDRLMVSVHYVDNMMYWMNKIGGDDWKSYIDDQCRKLEKAFTSKKIPVFLGETTSRYPDSNFDSQAKTKTSSECLEYVLTKLTECGFVPILWDVNDNFYSRTEFKVKNDEDGQVIKKIQSLLSAD